MDNGGRVPATGIVTLDGAPLSNVYVTFRPDDGERGNGGFAVTDERGVFEIYYPDTGKGLIPARYKVTVTAPPAEAKVDDRPVVAPLRMNAKSKQALDYPPIYSSPENTPLRVDVSANSEQLAVELFSTLPKSSPKR